LFILVVHWHQKKRLATTTEEKSIQSIASYVFRGEHYLFALCSDSKLRIWRKGQKACILTQDIKTKKWFPNTTPISEPTLFSFLFSF
jgi:nitroimidazol reductase NimA-like FMN-containing flavoprotein (pyridoxamine 5'-phosphate oxidase superfamily)